MRLRYLLPTLLAVAALVLASVAVARGSVAPRVKIPGAGVITVPYCQKHPPADLCLWSVGMHPNESKELVSGVELKTIHVPKYVEITVHLWYKGLDGWIPDKLRHYTKHDLPAVGHKGWLHPGVRAQCANGKWELELIFVGHTSKGNPRAEYFYWPASRIRLDKVLASDAPGGVPTKYWLGRKIRCLS